MQVQLNQIILHPGQQLLMKNVSWQMYEQLLEEFGEKRGSRINYSQGVLEVMVPLPEHEDDKVIISNLVEILLEGLEIEFRNLASTTFKNETMNQGLEADSCFYIENEAAVRGKLVLSVCPECSLSACPERSRRVVEGRSRRVVETKRIDLTVDPPPDLAIEIDITSRTHFNNYEALGVRELWRFNETKLEINVLQSGQYIQVNESPHFPGFPLIEVIPKYLECSKIEGRNKTMKAFRIWVNGQKMQIE